ncbi:GNAT family N-acetyltransferase [Bdellovibrio svalbardensis]|uniref:GNAT family N-acetyltransferase n=1 Tax=Bdellovibrio svalbardensis TaxID=2972972 RepID=A0ABT6DN56_9BACT|nr:GNAT family N-acetyltransferase [Bdellovibrio svalbardensis]MDG0817354.1 GNAT family N-acetyltransferase [Bdellovibrio svalbardensis]
MNFFADLYFQKKYSELYLNKGESVFEFKYQEASFVFKNISIKRPIYSIGTRKLAELYFDLETAYGFGGFCTNNSDRDFLGRAMQAYQARCKSENIIAEFLRFHPFNEFPQNFADNLDFARFDRSTVFIDLQNSKEDRWTRYGQTTRNILRKCAGSLEVQESNDIERFIELYYRTMDKNAAAGFYYFGRSYFESLLALDEVKLFAIKHEGAIVSMAFIIFGEEIAYYHLSANHEEFYSLNANYYMLDEVSEIVRKEGKKVFFLGGGRTPEVNDSLFKFKSKFSDCLQPFWIGGKIYNHEVFAEYMQVFNEQFPEKVNLKMFLKYRGAV